MSVNRYDANAWFRSFQWPIWHAVLASAGVPTATFALGRKATRGTWFPYLSAARLGAPSAAAAVMAVACTESSGAETWLMFDGQPVRGRPPAAARHAGEALTAHGIRLAEIVVDEHGFALGADTQPAMAQVDAEVIADGITRSYASHLGGR
jgi:hypothetical protein